MQSRVRTAAEVSEAVVSTLENYARRGVLRALSGRKPATGKSCAFDFVWFHNRTFKLIATPAAGLIRVPVVLPEVPPTAPMYAALGKFLKSRQSGDLPPHRLIAGDRCRVGWLNRNSAVEVRVKVLDDDYEYGTRSLIHLLNEVFLVFLREGIYRPYMIKVWELDPDTDQF